MEKFTIDEVSKTLNMSKSKLRYYEKIALIGRIDRDDNNNILYNAREVELINLIICMRKIGVSTKKIKKHIEDNVINDYSLNQILQEHKKALELKIREYGEFIKDIDEKLENI